MDLEFKINSAIRNIKDTNMIDRSRMEAIISERCKQIDMLEEILSELKKSKDDANKNKCDQDAGKTV